MFYIKKSVILLLAVIIWNCSNSKTDIYQYKRNIILNTHDKIKAIEIDNVLIGSTVRMCIINDYLIIADHNSFDKLIHLFDKNNFRHVVSIGDRGQGPDDITMMGHIEPDELNRMFYVNDHGKLVIYGYALDSVLTNPLYKPDIKMKMNKGQFPDRYCYINDTLSIGLLIEPTGYSTFNQSAARWNMKTEKIVTMQYTNLKVAKKRISLAVSIEDSIYVECYSNYDLMTICSLDGNLKYNIYGPDWSTRSNNNQYFGKAIFYNSQIIVSYSGENRLTDDSFPTKLLVFDIQGNYIQTLETEFMITNYCIDRENNRLILNLNDEIQFAYLNLNEVL